MNLIIPFWEIYISNLGARPVLVRFWAYMYVSGHTCMYVSDLDNSVTTVHILNSYRTLRSARLTYIHGHMTGREANTMNTLNT
jgi:hypothetical protein